MPLNANQLSATIAASTTSATAAIPFPNGTNGLRVHNGSAAVAFIRTGSGSQTAVVTDQFIGAGDTIVFQKNPNHTDFGVILSTGTGNVYIAPCQAQDTGE